MRNLVLVAAALALASPASFATAQLVPPPSVDVPKIQSLSREKAISAIKAGGRWKTVKWNGAQGWIFFETEDFARTGGGGPGTRGADGAVSYFRGKVVQAFVRLYPGPDASADLLRTVLGLPSTPPAPERDFRNAMTHRLDWSYIGRSQGFGPVYKTAVFHTKFMDHSEWTMVSVDLADAATIKAWENEEDKKPARKH